MAEVDWHALDVKGVLKELDSCEKGISDREADSRRGKYGSNELKQVRGINGFKIFLSQLNSVFVYILLFAGIFSFVIGHYIDFGVVMVIVAINTSIGFFQQYKAERTIAMMKNLLVPKVRVLRGGIMKEILSTELVPGDILIVSEGDKIMADCRLIHNNELQVNEAILTGESFPQKKISEKMKIGLSVADRENMLYMGTTVVNGNGHAVVVSTGMNTEFGKIAGIVQKIEDQKTPLEKKLDDFSKKVAVIVLILVAITVGIGLYRGVGFGEMFLAGVALAVSVIPEGIPAVIAITLALAIGRMHKSNALIRKLPAAETLGRVTVICTDKTGTLTEEEMVVTDLYSDGKFFKIKSKNFLHNNNKVEPLKIHGLKQLLKIGIMCNNAHMEHNGNEKDMKVFGDPTERAFVLSAFHANLLKKLETEKESRVIEYAFSSNRKLMSIVRHNNNGLVSYVKGSPDSVLKMCSKEFVNGEVVPLTAKRKNELIGISNTMAGNALRVLGFAYKELDGKKPNQNLAESELIFVGFQGIIDPPRKEVFQAIQDCYDAGIKVKMITGDSIVTAVAVSKMIGLHCASVEGHELEKMSQVEFDKCVKEKCVFARITPELKFRIVQSLKKQGEIVAVTGDGVNDVLALKEAHIGVAMGIRGTEVSREVSDIVLLDDNFASIVKAVAEGRKVYDNMKKSIKFHLSANLGELLIVMFALLLAFPLPLLPLAILWMNLITDSMPSLALSFENADENIMKRKPRKPEETILDGIIYFILVAGIIAFIAAGVVFLMNYKTDLALARTMVLTTCVFSELFLVFTCRSEIKNIWQVGLFSNLFLWFSVSAAVLLQLGVIYIPFFANIFGLVPLSLSNLLICTGLASAGFVFFEVQKVFERD